MFRFSKRFRLDKVGVSVSYDLDIKSVLVELISSLLVSCFLFLSLYSKSFLPLFFDWMFLANSKTIRSYLLRFGFS